EFDGEKSKELVTAPPNDLNFAKTNSEFIKKMGPNWMQKVPDLMFKVDMADCCGNTTNQVGFLEVEDKGKGSLPIPEVTISDGGTGNEQTVTVPNDEALNYDQKIVVNDPKTGQKNEFDAGQYEGTKNSKKENVFDLINSQVGVKNSNGETKPIGLDLTDKDKRLYEDVRLNISAQAYDNVDKFRKHKGLSATSFQIHELDKNGLNPTGKRELLESETGEKTEEIKKGVGKDANGVYANFDPSIKVYHIFRNPGWYMVEYKATDVPKKDGTSNTVNMKFRVQVLDQKQKVQTIDSNKSRQ
ncbi:hypothetical protein HYY75_02685, partial [bacterium]|nr:hypothetical protein [bacterium]